MEYNDPEQNPPEPIEWLTLWDRYATGTARNQYVREELVRIIEAGHPPLYAVMTLPLATQRDIALKIFRSIAPVVSVRLAPTAMPPPCDPYGRPLRTEKKGMALLKYATNGASATDDETTSNAWTGPARVAANRPNSRQPLYEVVEIGAAPVTLANDDRLSALFSHWGYGVRPNRWRGKGLVSRRDMWLLIEAPTGDRLLSPKVEATTPAPSKAGKAA